MLQLALGQEEECPDGQARHHPFKALACENDSHLGEPELRLPLQLFSAQKITN